MSGAKHQQVHLTRFFVCHNPIIKILKSKIIVKIYEIRLFYFFSINYLDNFECIIVIYVSLC